MLWGNAWAAAALLFVGTSAAAYAQSGNVDAQQLVNSWHKENSSCRGSSGVDPDTFPPCVQRQKLTQQLASMGYCFGKQGEAEYQMAWHRCGPTADKANALPNPFSAQSEPRLYKKYEEQQQQHRRDMQQLREQAEQRLQALRSGQSVIPAQAGRNSRDRNPYFEIGSQTAPAAETAVQRRESERKDQAIKLAKQEMARQEEEWTRERERLDKAFTEQVLQENRRKDLVEQERREQLEQAQRVAMQQLRLQREQERLAEQRANPPARLNNDPKTPSGQLAQSLPGPASSGWYVVMGPVINPLFEGNPAALDAYTSYLEMLRAMGIACIAMVVPASSAQSDMFSVPAALFSMRVTKRFGPFTDQQTSRQQLINAGWNEMKVPLVFSALSGCN